MRTIARRLSAALALTLAVLAAAPARADAPLADRLPENTLVYIGWKGADALGPAYEKSNLKGIIDAFNVNQLIEDIMKQAAIEAGADPKKTEGLKLLSALSSDAFRYPTAFAFAGVDNLGAAKPTPRLAMIVRAGKDNAAKLAETLTQAIKDNKDPDAPPASATVVGDYLLVTVGDAKYAAKCAGMLTDRRAASDPALAWKTQFKAALTHTLEDPAAMVYIDGSATLKLIDDAVAAKNNAREKEQWAKVADVLGIDSLKYAAFAGSFDGANWTSRGFVALDKQRGGLVQFIDNQPLSDDALKLIPASATWAGVVRFNGDKLLADVRAAMARINDGGAEQFDAGMKMFTNFTGIDLQKDLFASLGDEWVYYGSPDAVGNSLKGFTVACKLKDAQTAEKAFGDIETFIAGLAAQRGGENVKFATEKAGDVSMHIISWKNPKPASVAWAVANNTWYFSLTPQGLQAAIDHGAANKKADGNWNAGGNWDTGAAGDKKKKASPDITANPAFDAALKQLGNQKFSSFIFADLAKTGPENYTLLTQIVDQAQKQNPDAKIKFTMPAYEKLKPYMAPTAAFFWSDKDGWHMVAHEPFPGAPAFGGGQTALQAMMMESAQQARVRATSTASAASLRAIGVATAAYANDKDGALPPDLGALVKGNYITPAAMVKGRVARGVNFNAMTEEEKLAWVKDHADFVWIGKGKAADAGPDTVIAHEKITPGATKVNALYGDYSVRLIDVEKLK